MKTCTQCKLNLPNSSFNVRKELLSGLRPYCKSCGKKYRSTSAIRSKYRRIAITDRTGPYPFSYARSEAIKRGKDWSLSKDQFDTLTKLNCYYCELPLGKCGVGLDRLNNNLGYILSNVVPCCIICNYARYNQFTVDEMKKLGSVIKEIKMDRLRVGLRS